MTVDENLICSFHVLKPAELKKNGDNNKDSINKKVNFFNQKEVKIETFFYLDF